MRPAALLEARGAHRDLVAWADAFAGWRELWDACPRGDWLLGMAARLGAADRAVVAGAVACAELALDHLEGADPRALAALEAARAFAAGRLGAAASVSAARAAEDLAAETADPVAQAATLAIVAAARAAGSPDVASAAAAQVVQATVFAAGDCAMLAALGWAQRQTARRAREHLPWSDAYGA